MPTAQPELSTTEDLVKTFKIRNPEYPEPTRNAMDKLLIGRVPHRQVRLYDDGPLTNLYAMFNRERWELLDTEVWVAHYKTYGSPPVRQGSN